MKQKYTQEVFGFLDEQQESEQKTLYLGELNKNQCGSLIEGQYLGEEISGKNEKWK